MKYKETDKSMDNNTEGLHKIQVISIYFSRSFISLIISIVNK